MNLFDKPIIMIGIMWAIAALQLVIVYFSYNAAPILGLIPAAGFGWCAAWALRSTMDEINYNRRFRIKSCSK